MGSACCTSRDGGPEDGVHFPIDLIDFKKIEDGKCIVTTKKEIVKCDFGVWAVRIDKLGLSDTEGDASLSCPPLVADYMDTKGATEVYDAFMSSLAKAPPADDGTRHLADIWKVHAEFKEQFRTFDVAVFICQWEDEQACAEQPEEEPPHDDKKQAESERALAPTCQWVTFVDTLQAPDCEPELCLDPPSELPSAQEDLPSELPPDQEENEQPSSGFFGFWGGGDVKPEAGAIGADGAADGGKIGAGQAAAGDDADGDDAEGRPRHGKSEDGEADGHHSHHGRADDGGGSCSMM